jgi:hypothetical protein
MRLQQAISHHKNKAREREMSIGPNYCSREHLQLAKWLEELQSLRQKIRKEKNEKEYNPYP